MNQVEVQLNRYKYRFRKLTYAEEFKLDLKPGDDARKLILATAMTEVSGLSIPSLSDALDILSSIPKPVFNRIWVLFKAGVTEDRFFTTKGLYKSPDPHKIIQVQAESDQARSSMVEHAVSEMERKFGKKEVAETMEVERRIFEDARRRGAITKASPEKKT